MKYLLCLLLLCVGCEAQVSSKPSFSIEEYNRAVSDANQFSKLYRLSQDDRTHLKEEVAALKKRLAEELQLNQQLIRAAHDQHVSKYGIPILPTTTDEVILPEGVGAE